MTDSQGGAGPPDIPALIVALQASVPQALRERAQWLLWRFERYEGDKKPRKVPYWISGRKRKGVQGSLDDRGELCSFDLAMTHLARGQYQGVGFAFLPGDGLIGIDIDGAIDDDGVISERAAAIIAACGSYTELSPSGHGVHIIVAGECDTFKDNRIGLEVFCGRQFFTFTGRPWGEAPRKVVPIDDKVLRRLQVTVKGKKAAGGSAAAPAPGGVAPHVRRYCLAALDSAVQAVQGAGEGGRNDALNTQAFGLAQLVHTGGVTEAAIRAALSDAARAAGLADKEIEATLGSGVRAGLAEPRAVPEPRGRTPAVAAAPPLAAGAGAPTPSAGSAEDAGEQAPEAPEAPEAPRWRKLLLGEGGKKDCRENVFMYLANHPKLKGLVAYNEFAHQVVKTRPPPWESPPGEWTTNDDYFLALWLAQHERITFKGESTLISGVAMAAYAARFHPVVQFLAGLPAWDGIPRLRHWLHECLGAEDSDYTALVGSWVVMGMVRRVREPGCQHDYMIVLEGLQGRRKSTALRTLAVRPEWFADTPVRIGTPDALLTMAGKWVYEIAEMDSFNRAEATAVKGYITSRIDRVREPYARRFADRPRSGVLVGSTNQAEYFKDPTGARRFWPVACDGEIDIDKLEQWREQLFAEAMVRLASPDAEERRCWPTRAEEEKYLVPQQERREIVDPWFDRLAQWVDLNTKYGDTMLEVCEVESFTSFELLTKALNVPMDRIDGGRQMATRVGIGMHKLGWQKRRDAAGARVWRYWRPAKAASTGGGAGGPAPGVEGDAGGLHEF